MGFTFKKPEIAKALRPILEIKVFVFLEKVQKKEMFYMEKDVNNI